MSEEIKPIRDDESGHCDPSCPYLKEWEHPFWHHSAWCWKQMRALHFYDYYLADCIDKAPDESLVKIIHASNTRPPKFLLEQPK